MVSIGVVRYSAAPPPRPAPDAPTVSYPTIRRGSRGKAVRALQSALANLSFPVGTIDCDFGPKTDAAVRAFQRAAGVDVAGIVGPMTWTALLFFQKPRRANR